MIQPIPLPAPAKIPIQTQSPTQINNRNPNQHPLQLNPIYFSLLTLFTFLIIFSLTLTSAARLPTIDSDEDTWGTILNQYLTDIAGPNATQLNQTMVNSSNIYISAINTSHILDSTITDTDISDTTNLTLGQKITFTLGEIIDNIINGWITITGSLNVTNNITADWVKAKVNYSDIQNMPTSDWETTQNDTYDAWAYNQTTPSETYTDTQLTSYYTKTQADTNLSNYLLISDQRFNETSWILAQSYLTSTSDNSTKITYKNITDLPTCSGTDKLTYDGTTLSCSTDAGNMSFNQTLTDTLYTAIVWNYNQTTAAIAYTDAQGYLTSVSDNSSKIAYQNISNIPTCGASEHLDFDGTTLSCTADSGSDGSYNATYTLWAYNQTTPSQDYADSTFTTQSTFNSENTSIWTTVNTKISDYTNATTICNDREYLSGSGLCVNASDYNETTWVLAQGYSTGGTYNSTYSLWAYNQTTPAIAYTDAQNYLAQSTNITISDKITFRLNEIIDNLVNGWITITGSLNVTANVEIQGDIDLTNNNLTAVGCIVFKSGGKICDSP